MPQQDDEIGAFKVVGEIARGGMGVIYRVKRTDTASSAEYALKLVNDAALDPEGLARFQREMEALGRVSGHANVIRVSTSGVDPVGRPYYVMELVNGLSLHERVAKEGPLQPLALARLGVSLAGALEHIHAQGIVHRDLKPSNVMLRAEDGEPVLTDFGLASLAAVDKARLTRTQDVLGTPVFMPPEQAMGRSIDPRSDVYGLGAILFAAASGEPPVPAGQQMEVLSKVAMGHLTPLAKVAPRLPRRLAGIIEKALATRPEDRFATAADMARALEGFLEATVPDEEAPRQRPGAGETRVDSGYASVVLKQMRGPRRVLVPLLLVVVAGGAAALAVLVPRALAIRDQEKGARATASVRAAVALRKGDLERALDAGKSDEAIAILEDAAKPAVAAGLSIASAVAGVEGTEAAPAVGRALAARGKARLAATPALASDVKDALADLERAASLIGRSDPGLAADVGALRAEALFSLEADAEADRVLSEAAGLAPGAGARSLLRARLGRHRVATLDLRGAAGLAIEEPSADAHLLHFELTLACGETDGARDAFETLARAPGVPALEVLVAEVALARATHVAPATKAEELAKLAPPAPFDQARVEHALAFVSPRDAAKRLDAAIRLAAGGGARGRALRIDAMIAQAALRRRAGDLDGAKRRLDAALVEAQSPGWRARVTVERGRIAFVREESLDLSAAVAAVHSADAHIPGVAALRALDAREAVRGGMSRWTARILGGEEGVPADAIPFCSQSSFLAARSRAKRSLGVVQAVQAHLARPRRDLKLYLETDEALALATASDAWRQGGLRGFAEQSLRVRSPRDLPAERRRVSSCLASAVEDARLAVDLAPDDGAALVLLLEALSVEQASPDVAEEVKRLASRLQRVRSLKPAECLTLGRASSAIGDTGRALAFTAFVIEKEPFEEGAARRIRVEALRRGNDPKLRDELANLVEVSPFDLGAVEPLVVTLPGDKGDASQAGLRSYALGGAVGGRTFQELHSMVQDRQRALKWINATQAERDKMPMLERKMTMDSLGRLTNAVHHGELRGQLFWTRGEIGELSAQRMAPEALALVDLAEGARLLHERALTLLARVDAVAQDPRFAGIEERLEQIENNVEPALENVWYSWEDCVLLRAAFVAWRVRRAPSTVPRELVSAAIERCEWALDSNPQSTAARIVRANLLASVGRVAEAEEDLAAALTIAPELEKPDEPAAIVWIDALLEGARKRIAARAR